MDSELLSLDTPTLPAVRGRTLARLVSNVVSPPVVAVVGILLLALTVASPVAWWWAGLHILLTVVVPVFYIAIMVRRGKISDFYMIHRAQRTRPMLLMLACAVVAWVAMLLGDAPLVMRIFGLAGVLQLALQLLVTLRCKISGHSTAVTSLVVFLLALFGYPATPALLAIPVVVWARLRLNRHDLAQTILGAVAGAAVIMATLYVVSLLSPGMVLRLVSGR